VIVGQAVEEAAGGCDFVIELREQPVFDHRGISAATSLPERFSPLRRRSTAPGW
jgi:hypothetical protein